MGQFFEGFKSAIAYLWGIVFSEWTGFIVGIIVGFLMFITLIIVILGLGWVVRAVILTILDIIRENKKEK